MAVFASQPAYEISSYKSLVSPLIVETSPSRMPDVQSAILPTLNYPARKCSTRKQEQFVRVNDKDHQKTKPSESYLAKLYRGAFGWFARTNGFTPSTSRYIIDLGERESFAGFLILSTDRLFTPAVRGIQTPDVILVGEQKRIFYPAWLVDVNNFQPRQNYSSRPGELIREVECEWSDGPLTSASEANNEGKPE